MGQASGKTEFTERDVLLSPQGKPKEQFRFKREWIAPLVGGVCIIATICVVVAVTTSTNPATTTQESTEMLRMLRQSPPEEQEINVEEEESTTESASTTRRSILDFFRNRNNNPSVRSTLGRLRGVKLESRGGREYFGFYNVPYAQPPLGELRFMPPVPATAWNGTRDATVKGSMCTQKSRYNPDVEVEGTEDCLHVNIFTPKIPRLFRRTSYPVLTYFFGGGFMHGTANDFNAEYFMDEDVVLVIVESRVGAFGYLNTGDLNVTGNMGLKDQVEALRWVKNNIADFGGDPAKVVAFGSSSGATGAHGHLISPMTKGLISGVICLSGTMIMPGTVTFNSDPRSTAIQFGLTMNCSEVDDTLQLLSCLRNASAWDIALNQPQFSPSLEAIPEDRNLTTVFFPDTPINLIMQGTPNNVPWLVGVNSAEAILQSYSLLQNKDSTDEINKNFVPVTKALLGLEEWDDLDELDSLILDLQDFYFGNETINKESETRFNLTNMMGDRYYYHPTRLAGMQHAETSAVYWYYLTKEANQTYAESVIQDIEPPYGVSHADELQYVFNRPRYPRIPLDSPWIEFSKMLVKFLVSFADTGAPTIANLTEWPKVDSADDGMIWYNLDDVPMLIEPFTERMEFWDSLPFQLLYNSSNSANTEQFFNQDLAKEEQVL